MGIKKTRKRIYIFGAVLILLVFLHFTKISTSVERTLISQLLQIQASIFSQTNTLTYSFINYQEAQNLLEENQRLLDLVNELLYKNAVLDDLKVENDNLRALLQYQDV